MARAITPCRPKWRGTMTGRERFNRQMHFQPVDRSVNIEYGYWSENFSEWSIFVENGITNDEQANEFFNFDRFVEEFGQVEMHPYFEEKVVGETATTRIIQNASGVLAEMPKDGHATIPHYSRPTIVTPEDWKRLKEERFRRDDPDRRVDVAEIKKRLPATRDFPVGVDCGSMIGRIRNLLTFEGLAYATHDYPDMVEDMVETTCLLVEDYLDQVLGHVEFDFGSGFEDICFKNGPIISVGFFNSVIVPRYKRISNKLQAHGTDVRFVDCDGDVRPIIPGLLEGGVNCMFPLEINACGHPGELLRKYDGVLRIMGGVDKMVLAQGPREIKAYLESLAPLVARGGYIPFCDHRCPPNVPVENYLYYLDLKERMFGMKA